MRNEMELMRMSGEEKLIWLAASRNTLITVGVVWIGMTVFSFTVARLSPWFLLMMIPLFALVRFLTYRRLRRRWLIRRAEKEAGTDAKGE